MLDGTWAVVRLEPSAPLPTWASAAFEFIAVTRTADELSIVCPAPAVPGGVAAERGWAVLKLRGPFPFSQVGVLASFASPLAAAGISLFAISTFETDYILIKHSDLSAACAALTGAGHVPVPLE